MILGSWHIDYPVSSRAWGGVEMRAESAKWLIKQMERQARLCQLLLARICGIALTVASVGATNLTLTAVAERRTEIGLRRGVRARRRDMRRQSIAERVALRAVGGTAGIGVGIGCTWGMCSVTRLSFALVPTPVWIDEARAEIVARELRAAEKRKRRDCRETLHHLVEEWRWRDDGLANRSGAVALFEHLLTDDAGLAITERMCGREGREAVEQYVAELRRREHRETYERRRGARFTRDYPSDGLRDNETGGA